MLSVRKSITGNDDDEEEEDENEARRKSFHFIIILINYHLYKSQAKIKSID